MHYCNKLGRQDLGKLSSIKNRDIVRSSSSLIEPKFTRFSNHPERDFWHHNMNANASRLAWYGFPISSLPPNTSLHPVSNHCFSDRIHRWNPFSDQTRPGRRSRRGILGPTRLLHSWHWVLLWLALNFCTEFSQVQVHVNRRSIEAMNGEYLLYLYIAHLFWYAPAFKKLPLHPFFTLVEVMRITGSLNFS